ncbi:hypothetical protein RRG08_041348 [Elysia crispata]|uniref:Dermatopontin n=1 Tax=Elysia crispata TaxID=231223 RepID=A0AAE0ZM29_9GAST|nr:hypothetical protein RRG08_041348 [Elysia crispata]
MGRRLTNCHWMGYENHFDGELNFQCPPRSVVAGIRSYFNSQARDRRFKFKCCRQAGPGRFNNCFWSCYVNALGATMDFTVPPGKCSHRSVQDQSLEVPSLPGGLKKKIKLKSRKHDRYDKVLDC